jgi:hypothetical protein
LGPDFRNTNNLLAGGGLGLVIAAMWWVSGHLGFVAEHPETLESVYVATNTGRMESLTFTAPMAYTLDWVIFFSDTSKVLTLGVVTVVGVVVGAFVQAQLSRSFRWEGFRSTEDTALHLVGAVCMGVGGVTAMGCTVGQGLSGLSTLSLTSMIAVVGIFLGAIGGFRFQMWLLERECPPSWTLARFSQTQPKTSSAALVVCVAFMALTARSAFLTRMWWWLA